MCIVYIDYLAIMQKLIIIIQSVLIYLIIKQILINFFNFVIYYKKQTKF